MSAGEVILSVDYGTSNTVAVVQVGSGRAEPLLFDGTPLLPSAVWLDDAGRLLTGRDSLHTARLDPTRFEPNPKRRVDEQVLLLGSTEVPVVDAITAVLSRVSAEAVRTAGAPPDRLRMTHPAQWSSVRKQVLLDAAGKACLPTPELVAEPVAAAIYYTQVLQSPINPSCHIVVFDFGGGTLDVAIVARSPNGFDVVAVDGRDDLGGLDIDAMVVECIADGLPHDVQDAWQQLVAPSTPQQRRAARMLWEDARTAKEMLSRQATAPVQVPLLDRDVHVTRGELETKARPRLTEAATLTAELMRRAGIGPYGTGLFLVGGASRIPLVATTLLRATHVNPTALDRPELVVATGALTPIAPITNTVVAAPSLGTLPPPTTFPSTSPNAAPVFGGTSGVPSNARLETMPSPPLRALAARGEPAPWPAALSGDGSPEQQVPAKRAPSGPPRAPHKDTPRLPSWWALDVQRANRRREVRNIGLGLLIVVAGMGLFGVLVSLLSSGS
ncbi:Hsp70 family protein [Actinocatenispora comari]|uniref:Hsp70 family protein n=1 Tax=Actinocatenispora comari TaxID=2807577 RepID=A0A8J4A679_9ACTN|nr:Hsp70 family protein [Actinocatenispora comari]GIL25636.1 hypothetical protein NUM_08900 [Actinocatenispora comari]